MDIDRRVRKKVEKRGLFLLSPKQSSAGPDIFLFVCTDPDPQDCGFTRVGQVVGTAASSHFTPYVMDGVKTTQAVSLTKVQGAFSSWEDGVEEILKAYDKRT